ncbi:MAG: hypothetical protein GX256_03230, partial [Fretibacterium sp.]|nr:hypothetical protein [Fretibacterium sp.]
MSYKNFLVMLFFLMLFMTAPLLSLAQEQQGAVASVQAQRARQQKTASELGEGGVGGTDLRSIASPKKQGTTFTGFPGGAEPDSEARSEVEQPKVLSPEGRIVLSGSPI